MERLDYDDIPRRPGNNGRAVIGIALIFIGLMFMAINLNIIRPDVKRYIFSWEGFMIFLGLIFISNPKRRSTGIVLIAIGSFFLLPDIFYLPFNLRHLFFPAIIMGLGILFITRRKSSHHRNSWDTYSSYDSDFIDDISIFGGGERVVNSINFRGGRITSIFGGSQFNMVNAEPSIDGCFIDIISIFGGAKFIIPLDWNVRIEAISIFGSISDKRSRIPNLTIDPTKELVIKGITLFGGGEIKSITQVRM